MASDLGKSAGEMCDVIEEYTQQTGAGNALGYLNNGYRRALLGIDPRMGTVHEWSFLRPVAYVLTLTEHETGTILGVPAYSATTGLSTVTASAEVFFPSMVGGTFTPNTSGTNYEVKDYDSRTVIKVEGDASGDAGDTFVIDNSGIKALAADFGGLIHAPVYVHDPDQAVPDFAERSAEWIRQRYQRGYQQGGPEYYCTFSKTFASTTGERFYLWVWPPPDDDYDVEIPYRRLAAPLTDSTSCYLVGGADFSLLWEIHGLADAERRRMNGARGPYQEEADRLMLAMIDFDRRLLAAANVQRPLATYNTGLGLHF